LVLNTWGGGRPISIHNGGVVSQLPKCQLCAGSRSQACPSATYMRARAPRASLPSANYVRACAPRPASQAPLMCGLAPQGLSHKCQLYAGSRSQACLPSASYVRARAPRPVSQVLAICVIALQGLAPNCQLYAGSRSQTCLPSANNARARILTFLHHSRLESLLFFTTLA